MSVHPFTHTSGDQGTLRREVSTLVLVWFLDQ